MTHTRVPNLEWPFLAAVLLLAGLVSLPQDLDVGPISALGAISVLQCGGAWALWLARPRLNRDHAAVLLPLIMFALFAGGSILWFAAGVKGLQLLCVWLGFLAIVLLTAREVEEDPSLAARLGRVLDVAVWIATSLYAGSVALGGMGGEDVILARPYALFALIGVARQLAVWQAGDWRGLVGAALIVAVILASTSRVALVAAMLLFPIAALVRGDARGVGFAVLTAILGAAVLGGALLFSQTMRDRFFGYDVSMQVGGVWINASGRTQMWALLWAHAQDAPLLGWGVGSSSILLDNHFANIGHPHNDFLRFFHDFGGVGLALWLAFHLSAMLWLFSRCRQAARAQKHAKPRLPDGSAANSDYAIFLTPLLALAALAMAMFTDNAVSYSFVMAPLGVVFGCALGRSARLVVVAPSPRHRDEILAQKHRTTIGQRRMVTSRRRMPRRF